MSALTIEPLSQVSPVNIRWLWEPFLPRGKLALLDGDPGIGKSLITIDLASRLSRGGLLPDGKAADRPHLTLLLSAEDGPADTVRPRAVAAGADLDRVIAVTGSERGTFQFPTDLMRLAEAIRDHRPDLVVLDPITAFLSPQIAANSDQCVRRLLSPLAILADGFDCTILLVRHLRKAGAARAVHRGLGSVGFIASVRTGLLAARHPTDPARGVLTMAKANLAGPVPSLGYRIKAGAAGQPVVEWTGPEEVSADALIQPPEGPLRMRDRAVAWLHQALACGPRRATDLYEEAAAASIPERTLNRAKTDLVVKSHRLQEADRAVWWWYDPSAPWPADSPFKKPDSFEMLPIEFD